MEYRILEEKKDFEVIAKEIIRLRELYGTNSSFRSYSEGLLTYIFSKLINELGNKEAVKQLLKVVDSTLNKYSYIDHSGINLQLQDSNKLTKSKLISSISTFENITRSSIPYKVGNYFEQYFCLIAKLEIEEAITTAQFKEYNEIYHNASNYLRHDYTYKGLCIIFNRKTQNKLIKKWQQAIDDFKLYSRRLTKNQPHEIFNLLPRELRRNLDHPLKDKLKEIEETSLKKVISLQDLVFTLGLDISDKLNDQECKNIVDTLLSNEIIIEPNLICFKKNYTLEEKIILLKIKDASILNFDDYKLAALIADFGADLAYSDGYYSNSEAEKIYSLVSETFLKGEIEREHLKLRVQLYKSCRPKMNGIFKKITKNLGLNDLRIFSNYLVGVALADGVFRTEEDKKIRTVLSKLGLGEAYIQDLYVKFGINKVSKNVELRESKQSLQKGSQIPKEQKGIVIDKSKLSQLADDTKKVKSVLSEIIKLDFEEEMQVPSKNVVELELILDEKHKSFMKEIIKKREWDKNTIRDIAKDYNLMLNSAVFKINEWSEDRYGDYLIYEEEKYHIQNEILEEVKNYV